MKRTILLTGATGFIGSHVTERFVKEVPQEPKPLLDVSGYPMIIQSAKSLPNSQNLIFVTLQEHITNFKIDKTLKEHYPDSKIFIISQVTAGQAITCKLGLNDTDENSSLLIAATDNGMIYNKKSYQQLIDDQNVDGVVFTFKGHISSKNNPEMYGWVQVDNNNNATGVSVKKAISDNPLNDNAIVGTFYFKKVKYFMEAYEKLLKEETFKKDGPRIEDVINSMLSMNLNVKVFEVDDYICWGTPDDYETFVYWQSFFQDVSWHPYSLEKDLSVNKENIKNLDKKFKEFKQRY